MQYSDSLLEEIKSRISLSDIVGRYVSWDRRKSQPSKQDFWACCPFHNEKTPSFHVDDRRQIYKCFGCEAGGGHFQFLMEKEGVSFREAVEKLARESGVALPAPDPKYKEKEKVKATLAEVCEMACQYFESELKQTGGSTARNYLDHRGITQATIAEFRIGFAPDTKEGLQKFLKAKGVDENSMLEAGLVGKPESSGAVYDRFRGRIIIPIHDDRGRVVAFGGRSLDPDGIPKYLNSPETPLFQKRFMLFNFHRARQHAFDSKSAIIVEGYMDAIAIWQSGIKHVVASLGTAFTEQQIAKMWRMAPEPVICFDGDSAGTKAAYRAVDRVLPELKSGYSFNFVLLPSGKDPDDLIQEKGSAGFLEKLNNSVTLSDLLWEREVSNRSIDTPERKAALERDLYTNVSRIKDDIVKKSYRTEIRLRLSNYFWKYNRSMFGFGDKDSKIRIVPPGETRISAPSSEFFGIERTFCALCVKNNGLLEKYIERIAPLVFANDLHQRFKSELCRMVTDLSDENVVNFYDELDKPFFQILNEVLANEWQNLENNQLSHQDRFLLLNQRLPVLRYNPQPEFIESVFVHYLESLELRNLEREINSESDYSTTDVLKEEDWERMQALKLELDKYRSNFRRREHALQEEVEKLCKGGESTANQIESVRIGN